MHVIGICGSLRAGSSNEALLKAAAFCAPAEMRLTVFTELGSLPHFNPDLDVDPPPEAVREFRALLASANGVLISSPEYAHGVPGSLKNALDWVVSSGELGHKPVVLLNASAGTGEFATRALRDTLEVMEATVVSADAGLFVKKKLDAQGRLTDPEVTRRVTASLDDLAAAIRARDTT
jgi:NAD(P)H-dependent FMN reductase